MCETYIYYPRCSRYGGKKMAVKNLNLAVAAVGLRRGPSTYDEKEKLKEKGYRWNSSMQEWVKPVSSVAKMKSEIKILNSMKFGSNWGIIKGDRFYDDARIEDVRTVRPVMPEKDYKRIGKEIYSWKMENKLR